MGRTASKQDDNLILSLSRQGIPDDTIAKRHGCTAKYVAALRNKHCIPKPTGGAAIARQMVFTTGQVAKICKVASRTVANWFDSGRLKGYHIPGGTDRRIPRENLIRFLKEHEMPLGDLSEAAEFRVLVVGNKALAAALRETQTEAGGYIIVDVDNTFDAGTRSLGWRPQAVVLDFSLSRRDCIGAAKSLRGVCVADLACITAEDENDGDGLGELFDRVYQTPCNPAEIGRWLSELREQIEK